MARFLPVENPLFLDISRPSRNPDRAHYSRLWAASCPDRPFEGAILKVKVSILIPAYNEEETIAAVIQRVESIALEGIKKEIIVIDDASSDRTGEVLKGIRNIHAIRHSQNAGKGAALTTGIRWIFPIGRTPTPWYIRPTMAICWYPCVTRTGL